MRSVATELARAYLQVLWRDSAFRGDWEQVKRGALEFQAFANRWKLPPALVRAFKRELELPESTKAFYEQAVPDPEAFELQRLLEGIPAVVASGTARVEFTDEGFAARLEPEPLEKPLESLPEPAPEGETQSEYLNRVRALLEQERGFASLLEQVQGIEDPERRNAYLKALEGQEPRLLPEYEQRYGNPYLNAKDVERQVLLLARRYYEACAERTNPVRAFNRENSPEYLSRVAEQVYLRVIRGWSWGQLSLKFSSPRSHIRETTLKAMERLGIPPKTV